MLGIGKIFLSCLCVCKGIERFKVTGTFSDHFVDLFSCSLKRHKDKHASECKHVFVFSCSNISSFSSFGCPGLHHRFQVTDTAGGSGLAAVSPYQGRGKCFRVHPPAVQRLCNAVRAVAVVTTSETTSTMCRNDFPWQVYLLETLYFQLPSRPVNANGQFVQTPPVLMSFFCSS